MSSSEKTKMVERLSGLSFFFPLNEKGGDKTTTTKDIRPESNLRPDIHQTQTLNRRILRTLSETQSSLLHEPTSNASSQLIGCHRQTPQQTFSQSLKCIPLMP